MDRRIEVAEAIVGLGRDYQHLSEKIDEGFSRMDEMFSRLTTKLEEFGEALNSHGQAIKSLEESRQRQRNWTKWIGGIASTVIAALLLALGLKK